MIDEIVRGRLTSQKKKRKKGKQLGGQEGRVEGNLGKERDDGLELQMFHYQQLPVDPDDERQMAAVQSPE